MWDEKGNTGNMPNSTFEQRTTTTCRMMMNEEEEKDELFQWQCIIGFGGLYLTTTEGEVLLCLNK